ncbi:MAG: prolyl oligopeptidase family serine peptidase [Salinibacter sp.]
MQTFSTSAYRLPANGSAPRAGGLAFRPVLLGLFALGLLLGGVPSQTWAQSDPIRAIQAEDLYRIQDVRDVRLSPHGRSVAYTVRSVASPPSGPSPRADRTQLYVTRTTGDRGPRLLARDHTDASHPAWHPDGTHLAFVQPVDGTPQVFVASLTGGPPYQLTDTPHGAQRPQWSPDGEQLLFASAVPEPALEQRTGRPAPSERPGRTPQDLTHSVPPDTLLVLRHSRTLDPVDTLALRPEDRQVRRADTARTLRTPGHPSVPDSLAAQPIDSLNALTPDSLRALFDRLRLRPDTTTVPVVPDTAATPDGNLVQVRRWLNRARRPGAPLVSSRLDLQGEHKLQPIPTYRHHFVVDVPSNLRSRTPPRPEARPVTQGYRSFGHAEWLSGGSQIVVSGMPSTGRPPDRVQQRNLYVVDLNRNEIRRLLKIENYALTAPAMTADGNTVAFRAQRIAPTRAEQADVGLFALNGRSQPRFITGEFDRDVESFRWAPNGWHLYVTAPSQGRRPLYRFTPFARDTSAQTTRPVMTPDRTTSRDQFPYDSTTADPAGYRQMTVDARTVHAFDVNNATITYAATDPSTPSALYTNTVSFDNERPLATPNADWLSRRRLATPTEIVVANDSLDIYGRVTRPSSATDSLPAPLLVQVRGGPEALSDAHASGRWFERQYLASRGIGLLEVYPRGSEGFGAAFRRANDQDWGPGPAQDVLALTDSAAALSWSDSTQVAVSGTAYGGTVATWLLGHTDRFEAAVALNGIYDLSALMGEGHAWRSLPREFGGYPWEGGPSLRADSSVLSVGLRPPSSSVSPVQAALRRNSPITYADQIETPLLLLQGAQDRRVGLSQSERMYKRLKILERPVEYVRYPGVGHDFSATASPTQRVDRLVRTYEFLARFLDVPSAPPRSFEPALSQP